jgi:hypothetical protein
MKGMKTVMAATLLGILSALNILSAQDARTASQDSGKIALRFGVGAMINKSSSTPLPFGYGQALITWRPSFRPPSSDRPAIRPVIGAGFSFNSGIGDFAAFNADAGGELLWSGGSCVPFGLTFKTPFESKRLYTGIGGHRSNAAYFFPDKLTERLFIHLGYGHATTGFFWEIRAYYNLKNPFKFDYYDWDYSDPQQQVYRRYSGEYKDPVLLFEFDFGWF